MHMLERGVKQARSRGRDSVRASLRNLLPHHFMLLDEQTLLVSIGRALSFVSNELNCDSDRWEHGLGAGAHGLDGHSTR
jgi:hypothetical protein